MKQFKSVIMYIIAAILTLTLIAFLIHHYVDNEQVSVGLHKGKMLINGNIAVEVLINEDKNEARFFAYIYENRKLVSPQKGVLRIKLERINNYITTIHFKPIDNYLQSEVPVAEPHSFKVTVLLKFAGKDYTWNYNHFENRIALAPNIIKSASIKSSIASETKIEKKLPVIGKILLNGDTLLSVYPRFPGMITELKKKLGEPVAKGEHIASIESNESLQNYPIVSPIDGTIVQKYVVSGEIAKVDKAIYQIANLETVWADLTLYRKDAMLIKKGMPVTVTGDNGKPQAIGNVDYISPLGIEDSQTILARTVLSNTKGEWVPGMYVNATITYLQKSVPVAVFVSAIQKLHDSDVVFVQQDNIFEATPVQLGEHNNDWVEVVSGLRPGQTYVAENSYLLKAELVKSQAEHNH